MGRGPWLRKERSREKFVEIISKETIQEKLVGGENRLKDSGEEKFKKD